NRASADSELFRQLALGGQAVAGFEDAAVDQAMNLLRDLLVPTGLSDDLELRQAGAGRWSLRGDCRRVAHRPPPIIRWSDHPTSWVPSQAQKRIRCRPPDEVAACSLHKEAHGAPEPTAQPQPSSNEPDLRQGSRAAGADRVSRGWRAENPASRSNPGRGGNLHSGPPRRELRRPAVDRAAGTLEAEGCGDRRPCLGRQL